MIALTPEELEERIGKVRERRSPHGRLLGITIERCAPGEIWASIAYNPVFAGTAEGVLHGGLVTTMLDECCGAAVQMALPQASGIATLDLRIDYMRPAEPGKDLQAHAVCYRVTRSIAFVRATAYQDDPAKPIASAAAAFMIAANRTNMMAEQKPKITYDMLPPLAVPDEPTAPELAQSSYARFLGIQVRQDGTTIMPYHVKLTGNPILPALHGGTIGSFLETTAVVGVAREIGADMQPKPVGLTINYLRSGKSLDTFARVKIVKQGRRVVAFEAQAWQTSPSLPIASAYGHFMLKKEPGADA